MVTKPFTILTSMNLIFLVWTSGVDAVGAVGWQKPNGAGTTIGEEVEQVNSFLSRVALTTKYMSKAGKWSFFTVLMYCALVAL